MKGLKSFISVKQYEVRTIRWWYLHREEIDLEPDYQRSGNAWTPFDKAFLIDSILNGYDLPKLYFVDFHLGEGLENPESKRYSVVDGKQRLLAIFEFMDGFLRLNKDFSLRRTGDRELAGKTFLDIREQRMPLAMEFEDFILPVFFIATDSRDEIEELFRRLNRSKPLTGTELRNATKSIANSHVKSLASHSFFKEICSFKQDRLENANIAAKLLYLAASSEAVDTKKKNLDNFVVDVSLSEKLLADAAAKCEAILDDWCSLFDQRDELFRRSGLVAPYFFYVLKHRSFEHSDAKRLRAFEECRRVARDTLGSHRSGDVRGLDHLPLLFLGFTFSLYHRSGDDAKSYEARASIINVVLNSQELEFPFKMYFLGALTAHELAWWSKGESGSASQ